MATSSRTKNPSRGMKAAERNRVGKHDFAFPKERKEPLTDEKHVRNAIARFDQVKGVTDSERDTAWRRIRRAAKKYGIKIEEKSWRNLGSDGGKPKSVTSAEKRGEKGARKRKS